MKKRVVIILKERITVGLDENINHIFKIFFTFWFLISSFCLFPILRVLSLSRNFGIYSYIIAYYIGILVFLGAGFLSKKVSIKISIPIFLILNIILAILFNKVKILNFNSFQDSILRSLGSLTYLAFIRHARQVKQTIKIQKNKQEINQENIYRDIALDEIYWTKAQEKVTHIEYICYFCILFFVLFMSNKYLIPMIIFINIVGIFRLMKNKWVLVDEDGKVV